jgi:hypothetical protein
VIASLIEIGNTSSRRWTPRSAASRAPAIPPYVTPQTACDCSVEKLASQRGAPADQLSLGGRVAAGDADSFAGRVNPTPPTLPAASMAAGYSTWALAQNSAPKGIKIKGLIGTRFNFVQAAEAESDQGTPSAVCCSKTTPRAPSISIAAFRA